MGQCELSMTETGSFRNPSIQGDTGDLRLSLVHLDLDVPVLGQLQIQQNRHRKYTLTVVLSIARKSLLLPRPVMFP